MDHERSSFASPIGVVELELSSDGALVRLSFTHGEVASPGGRESSAMREVRRQLEAYFSGELRSFDLELDPVGTPFQQLVWCELQRIPFGITRSYTEVAERIGNPLATRAVGAANGRNPIAIIIPCHRVVGLNGALTGYAAGIETKAALLGFEQSVIQPNLPF